MKAPKKPNYRKKRKEPKKHASKETWNRFHKNVEDDRKYNQKLSIEYKKELKDYEQEMKKREKIKQTARGTLGKIV